MEMTLYDFNKQVISQQKPLTEEGLEEGQKTIKGYIDATDNTYYMLLCNDIKYYTLFARGDEGESCDFEVINVLQELGPIKAIVDIDDAVEIWIEYEDEVYVMYFFAYDRGVIECQR